jgi:hypothetical protein
MKYRCIPPIKMIRIIVRPKKITIEFANPSKSRLQGRRHRRNIHQQMEHGLNLMNTKMNAMPISKVQDVNGKLLTGISEKLPQDTIYIKRCYLN